MPFDPNIPANGSQVRSDELRSQFTGLKTLIDALPTDVVTPGDLSAAINGTAKNADGVTTLYQTISDPPTQSEVQAIQDKLNELIMALRRNV